MLIESSIMLRKLLYNMPSMKKHEKDLKLCSFYKCKYLDRSINKFDMKSTGSIENFPTRRATLCLPTIFGLQSELSKTCSSFSMKLRSYITYVLLLSINYHNI